MAKNFFISIPSKLRKEEYATYFAEAVLNNPNIWLTQLTQYELILLQKLVKAGPDTYIEELDGLMLTTLEVMSLVVVERNFSQGGKVRYMICDELREAISYDIAKYLSSKEQEIRFLVEQHACGILNLYGLMTYNKMLELLKGHLRNSVTDHEINESLTNSVLIRRLTFEIVDKYSSVLYIHSPLLWEIEDLDNKLYEHRDIIGLKTFTKEEVFLAGAMPVVCISNSCFDEIKQFMINKLGYTESLAEFKLLLLWYYAQLEDNMMNIITSMIHNTLSSIKELQKAIELFTSYCNECPRWFLRGYSSEEIFASSVKDKLGKKTPRIVAGPYIKAAGMDITPELQTMLDSMLGDTFSEQKTGRNDPCPCGSGKKYKKCCGREN
ncbi:SEC-C metal-binding domain-containing protein [Bacteroides sp.]|uniref:YecA family protein n=1 Tax=Bacteroides sp. TaxID=29523 RepID=UPI00261BF680|nr:SEC-C metal-binding domain-containing protein [Bacteroides sp.]MDD3036656.1 SEC-C metal-binding domain-containing protein [Bacteroides sp.]